MHQWFYTIFFYRRHIIHTIFICQKTDDNYDKINEQGRSKGETEKKSRENHSIKIKRQTYSCILDINEIVWAHFYSVYFTN